MTRYYRRTAPQVRDGKVQRKNRWAATQNYWNTTQEVPVIDKERPGRGYRHVLRPTDVVKFISILPDWTKLARGLDAVLLARGQPDCDGWYDVGVVGICAWERAIWREVRADWYEDHQQHLRRLGVPCERRGDYVTCRFTEGTARAYQLLHVFLHELGHHHDRMTTKSQRAAARGESYAEEYALRYEETIWQRYVETFGMD